VARRLQIVESRRRIASGGGLADTAEQQLEGDQRSRCIDDGLSAEEYFFAHCCCTRSCDPFDTCFNLAAAPVEAEGNGDRR
jgi:hypothetical protein